MKTKTLKEMIIIDMINYRLKELSHDHINDHQEEVIFLNRLLNELED